MKEKREREYPVDCFDKYKFYFWITRLHTWNIVVYTGLLGQTVFGEIVGKPG